MGDMKGAYSDKLHPKHERTMERVHQLARIITARRGGAR